MANLDFVGDYVARFVADGLDLADGEAAIVESGTGFLKHLVEIVLERGRWFRRSKDAGIHSIDFDFAGLGEQFNLVGVERLADLLIPCADSQTAICCSVN